MGSDVPFLHMVARRIELMTSSAAFRQYQAQNPKTLKNKLNYLAFSLLNKVMADIARGLQNEPSITAASKMNVDRINLEAIMLADRVLNAGLVTIATAIMEAEAMEVCLLYTTSVFHSREVVRTNKTITIDEVHKIHVGGARGRRKVAPADEEEEPPKKQPHTKNVGALIYNQVGIMPMPYFNTYPKGETHLCGTSLRHGSRGCNNPA